MIKRIFCSPILYCILLLALSIIGFVAADPDIENVRIIQDGVEKKVSLPYSEGMRAGEIFQVDMDVVPSWIGSMAMKIIPDDCAESLNVNGVDFDVKKYPGYCEWSKGFVLPAGDIEANVAKASVYHVAMKIKNGGGLGGVSVDVFSEGKGKLALEVFIFLLVAATIFLVGSKIHIDKRILLLVILGVFLRIAYTHNTSYQQRSYDADGHLEYINIVADQHRIPAPKECWSCYHPATYYVGMAPVKYAATGLGLSPNDAFQWCSFLMSFAMLVLGLAVLRHACSGGIFWLSAILWTFWPGIILSAPRIGNDIPFYFAHVLSLWGCVRYMATDKAKYILVAVLAAFASYWSKTTGVVTIGLLGLTFCTHFVPRLFTFERKSKMEYASVGLFFVLSLVVALLAMKSNGIVGNTGNLNGVLRVGNAPSNFLYFDVQGFLSHAFTNAWRDGMGREYFWNYLAKTSLFGEFNLISSDLGLWLASIISFIFLILLVVGIRGLWKMKWTKISFLLFVQGFVFLLAEAYMRYKYPYSCSNDFRFIIPGMISYAYFVGNGFFEGNVSLRFKAFGFLVAIAFALCSTWLLLLL